MKNNKVYNPVQALTIKVTEDVPAFRFVSYAGALCIADQRALGVSEIDWVSGEYASVISLGTIAIETASSIGIGDAVTSTTNGKAVIASGNSSINGRALDSCTGAGFIRIKLVP